MNFKSNQEIPIIGAGPSGLFAAIRLKDHGFNPVIYEAKSAVGLRFHGDFQGLENWSTTWNPIQLLKENGVDISFRCVPSFGGIFYGPNKIPQKISTQDPMYYLIRRGNFPDTLDTSLLNQAMERNIPVKFHHRIKSIPNGAIVSEGPRNFNMIAKGFTFETSHPNTAIGLVDDDLAPKGYVYLLIDNGLATFSTVIYKDFKNIDSYAENSWIEILRLTKIQDVQNLKSFGGFGNSHLSRKPFPDRYFPVGEAAGYQDYLFGFGIKFALISSYYATEAIIKNESYERMAKKHIDPVHQVSIVNRFLFEKLRNRGYNFIMGKVGLSRNPLYRLQQQFRYNVLKKMIYPFAVNSFIDKLERNK